MLWEMIFPFFNWFKKRWATTSMICWRVIPKVRFNGSDSLSTGLKLAKHEKSFSFWDETEIMKNLSRAARTHQALVCKGSALVCNNRLQQDSIIQKFFLVKFLEMVRSIKIPWVHVMSTNYDKSASDFHQFPIWVRFYVLSVFKGNIFPQFPIKDNFFMVSSTK